MNLRKILEAPSTLTIEELEKFQREYDARFVDTEFSGFNKVRHTYAHMGELLGRLAKYVQKIEDGEKDFSPQEIKEKVIPDLLVYSLWLAKEFNVDLGKAYVERIVGNIGRLHSDKISEEENSVLRDYTKK